MGHTLRDCFGVDCCGRVWQFTGYNMQENNGFHGDMDHNPFAKQWLHVAAKSRNLERRKELWNCAVKFSQPVLAAWAACKEGMKDVAVNLADLGDNPVERNRRLAACAFNETLITNAIQVEPSQVNVTGGGSPWISAGAMCPNKQCSTNEADIAKNVLLTPGITARPITFKYTDDVGAGGPIEECQKSTIAPQAGTCTITLIDPVYNIIEMDKSPTQPVGTMDVASVKKALEAQQVNKAPVAVRHNWKTTHNYMGCLAQIGSAESHVMNGQALHRELAMHNGRVTFTKMFSPVILDVKPPPRSIWAFSPSQASQNPTSQASHTVADVTMILND